MREASLDRVTMLRELAARCRAGAAASDDPTTIETLLQLARQLEEEAANVDWSPPPTPVPDAA
jgi:hypothetical protein